jgi:hypothetical protein
MPIRRQGESSSPPDMGVCFKTGRFLHFFLGPNECKFVITTPAMCLKLSALYRYPIFVPLDVKIIDDL